MAEQGRTHDDTAPGATPLPEAVPPVDTLHLYAQDAWHDPAYLVGTREALTRLRATLDAALTDPSGTTTLTTFATDGEGYTLHVVCASAAAMQGYAMPYTWEAAKGGETGETNPAWPKKKRR